MLSMKLCEALGIRPGEVVTFVGAGGKTTAIWRAQAELAAEGERVIATTTTKVMEPVLPRDGALMLAARPDAVRVADLLDRAPRLVLAARRLGNPAPAHADHPVPSRPFKLDGLPSEILDGLVAQLTGVTWLVEADGAKGCGIKIHAVHEPVIPASVTTVVVTMARPPSATSSACARQMAVVLPPAPTKVVTSPGRRPNASQSFMESIVTSSGVVC